ncbi:MAG: cytochrome c3 family protein [Desulfobacterales bacterium]
MKHRYFLFSFFSLIFAVTLVTSSAWSQEKQADAGIMKLKSKEFGRHSERPVIFDHYVHEIIIGCRVCHHDFNVFTNRNEGKGSKCSGCHKKQLTKEIPIPLLTAFHKKCIGCHENYINWGRKSGPLMCGYCHK